MRGKLTKSALVRLCVALSLVGSSVAHSQDSHWASADDPTAKDLINLERLWMETRCKPSEIGQKVMAEDFVGTSPADGSLYTKQDALKPGSSHYDENCQLLLVKVHFFGDSLAVLYGKEGVLHAKADGRRHTDTRVWTDTWLKRHGLWQVISAQDTDLKP